MVNTEFSNKDAIDLAYKYPFSSEAKNIIKNSESKIEQKLLSYGTLRVQKALDREELILEYDVQENIKLIHIRSYVYARMLISTLKDLSFAKVFARAEAKRAVKALMEDTEENILLISNQLGTEIKKTGNIFMTGLVPFLLSAPKVPEFSLTRQNLKGGEIYLTKEMASKFLSKRIELEILKNLPIPISDLPREVIEYSKNIKLPLPKIDTKVVNIKKYGWIEKLLIHPIADVRHRTVNLILAPYFTNIKSMSEEDAVKAISSYIEKCKELNPDTNVNETYIRYQVRYSKSKGMKPLSAEKAKELLGVDAIFR